MPHNEPAWGYLQLELIAEDHLYRTTYGENGLDRHQAQDRIQQILDKTGLPIAEDWKTGVKDDTIYAGHFVWAIFPYQGNQEKAVNEWVADFARMLSDTGITVGIAQPRNEPR